MYIFILLINCLLIVGKEPALPVLRTTHLVHASSLRLRFLRAVLSGRPTPKRIFQPYSEESAGVSNPVDGGDWHLGDDHLPLRSAQQGLHAIVYHQHEVSPDGRY